jgi:hypothetical protein
MWRSTSRLGGRVIGFVRGLAVPPLTELRGAELVKENHN